MLYTPAETHVMELEAVYPAGCEEWWCPECGRRVLLQWRPLNRIVMIVGNEHADHLSQSRPDDDDGLDLTVWGDFINALEL